MSFSGATHPLFATPSRHASTVLDRDTSVDDLICGAGITGLTAAVVLARAGRRVMVVDAHPPHSGVTAASTGHLSTAIDGGYVAVERHFGPDAASLVAASMKAALRTIEEHAMAHGNACGFQRVPGFLAAEHTDEQGRLADELKAATRAGIEVRPAPHGILPYPVFGALWFEGQGVMDPSAYARMLADEALHLGVTLHDDTRVLAIEDGSPCRVHTERGPQIAAQQVVLATHKPQTKVLVQTKLRQRQSYVVAFRWDGGPVFPLWDCATPYHYVRTATLGGDTFLIVGGEDHDTGTSSANHSRFAALADYTHKHFSVSLPAAFWSAQVVESLDGLPFIGRERRGSNVHVATGFGGDGLIFGTLAATLIADAILGRPNPYGHLYDATRSLPLGTVGAFVKRNVEAPLHLLGDRLTRPEGGTLADLPRGQGRIVRVKGHRLAVYRDDAGALHGVSAVCTHLGCLVHFNEAETTWDCPCHGSRFDTAGHVLEGPASKPLRKLEVSDDDRDSRPMPPRTKGETPTHTR
jgi:glycine/D-amino acid oxidase-like deaminating enzyme/nitrite reductase/ring-hydroxylating ferredoxin subunit